MMSTWLSTGRFQVIFADNRPHVALKISEALYVSEILNWFVEEEGLLLGEELNKTYNVARDPVLICLEGGLTPELKDKLPERLCNKPHFFLYFVVRQYFQFKSLGHFNILPYFLTRQHHVHLIKQCICKPSYNSWSYSLVLEHPSSRFSLLHSCMIWQTNFLQSNCW